MALLLAACGGTEKPRATLTLEEAKALSELAPDERAKLTQIAAAVVAEANVQARQDMEADLAQGSEVPPLDTTGMWLFNGSSRPDSEPPPSVYDGGSLAGRILFAAGATHLVEAHDRYTNFLLDACQDEYSYKDRLPDSYRYHRFADLLKEACPGIVEQNSLPDSLLRMVDSLYVARMSNEVKLISGYLIERLGNRGDTISADQERTVLYLGRIARYAPPSDGSKEFLDLANDIGVWRDDLVSKGAITSDLQAELASREESAQREATFRANEELSSREARAKAGRSPAQKDSVRAEICKAFGQSAGCAP